MFSLMGNCVQAIRNKRKPIREITLASVGLDNAGKTSIAKGLAGELTALEDVAPTCGFSNITFQRNRFRLTIFDLGGGKNIRGIWRNYLSEAHGLIFTVDSSDQSRLLESREELSRLLTNARIAGKPVLVFGNKQDKDGALDEIDICTQLELELLANGSKCPTRVEMCSMMFSRGKKLDTAIYNGFDWLLAVIDRHFEELSERVEEESAQQRADEQKAAALRAKRVAQAIKEREEKEETPNETNNNPPTAAVGFRPIGEVLNKTANGRPTGTKEKSKRSTKKNQVLPLSEVAAVSSSTNQQ